jgi:hypothetical protein
MTPLPRKHITEYRIQNTVTIHTGLGSSSLIAHVLHSPPPPPREQLCNRSCSNKNTHTRRSQIPKDFGPETAQSTQKWTFKGEKGKPGLRALPPTSMTLVMLPPHVLGPKYERRQRTRNSQRVPDREELGKPGKDTRRGRLPST